MNRTQKIVFVGLLLIYACSAFLTYTLFLDQLALTAGIPLPESTIPPIVLGLANAGIVLVLYGLLGLIGDRFATRLGLPGIFSTEGNWHRWFVMPLVIGIVCGLLVTLGDILFAPINGFGRLVHPPFPVSILASLSAGIGEEILFRGFVFGLWAIILNWLLKRFDRRALTLWIANVIAAIAFGAGHLGTLLVLTGATSLSELNPILIIGIILLNGVIGLAAGGRYMKDGLVAAVVIHFWTDIVFHVIWGLL